MKFTTPILATALACMSFAGAAAAEEDLAKQSQNPLGTVISLPFENNSYFGIGPSDSLANVLGPRISPGIALLMQDRGALIRTRAPLRRESCACSTT